MKNILCNNKKGFTLVELIVVIAILSILIMIAVPRFGNAVEGAELQADRSSTRALNTFTLYFRNLETVPDPFEDDTNSNGELIQFLVDNGYMESFVEPQSKDAEFIWDFDNERWYLYISGDIIDGT